MGLLPISNADSACPHSEITTNNLQRDSFHNPFFDCGIPPDEGKGPSKSDQKLQKMIQEVISTVKT
jgi:hypothetical protein